TRPLDMRGTKFVPDRVFKSPEKLMGTPPVQLKATSRVGQPKEVLLISESWPELIRSCEGRRIPSNPKSVKGARVTGPAMGIRYSTLPKILVSPPGKTMV